MFVVQFFNRAVLTVLMGDLHYSFNVSAHICTALEHKLRGMSTNTDSSKTSFDFHGVKQTLHHHSSLCIQTTIT